MKMTVAISKQRVIEGVKMQAAYFGAKSGDCRRLLLTDSDSTMLEALWLEAETHICGAVPGLTIAEGEDTTALAAHLSLFMQAHMLAGWMNVCLMQPNWSVAQAEQGWLQRRFAPKTRRAV